jgi:hypothetical protein
MDEHFTGADSDAAGNKRVDSIDASGAVNADSNSR